MPGVYGDGSLGAIIRGLAQRIRALETQQQMTLSNGNGLPIMNFGLIPGSNPAEYGMQLVAPNPGGQLAFFGEDAAGNVALKFFDPASGVLRLEIDYQGLHVYDTAGNEEARLGELNTSPAIYGLGVAPSTGSTPGTLQQVGGFIGIAPTGVTGATNTAYTAFGGTNTITAVIGPSTTALVQVHADIATGGANVEGVVGVQLDGGTWYDFYLMSCSATSGAQVFAGNSNFWTGIPAGSHTFTMGYKTASGTVDFNDPLLIVQPL
ncbi:MAG TPA: hypothetical protein VNF71_07010 [Acidimicrobiales bacterium]|nr:hypothetical protein [Acidimicrobiales bacterium]